MGRSVRSVTYKATHLCLWIVLGAFGLSGCEEGLGKKSDGGSGGDTILGITTPVADSSVTTSAASSVVVAGTCAGTSDVTLNATTTGGATTATATATCATLIFNTFMDLSALENGTITITATQDGTSVTRDITKTASTDVTDLAFSTPDAGTVVEDTTLAVTGTCETEGSTVNLSSKSSAGETTADTTAICASHAWSKTLDFATLNDGTITVTAKQDGAAGSPATRTFTLNTSALKLYLQVKIAPESATDESKYVEISEVLGTTTKCKIKDGDATTLTCKFDVPEGQLYFGKARFTIGTKDTDTCTQVIFRPTYFIRSSTNATFFAPGADTSVDCTVMITDAYGNSVPKETACWGGAAKEIVSSFPKYHGMYFLSKFEKEHSWEAGSANSKLEGDNRWLSSFYTTFDPTTGVANKYDANSYSSYSVQCRDVYSDLKYQINFDINEVDGPGGNQHLSWDDL